MSQTSNDHDHDEHKEITVETLTTPPLRIPAAPVWRRIVATVIDSAIIGAFWLILRTANLLSPNSGAFLNAASLGIIVFAYYFLQEWIFASTVGKRFEKLRVVGKSGDSADLRESLIRNIVRFVDFLPLLYLLGAVLLATSNQRRRLGDIVAGTMVTPAPEKDINPPPAPFLFH